ncbi:hypothetical protein MRBLMR1_001801 [Neorhizobium sp. LMR1-1-1.1]
MRNFLETKFGPAELNILHTALEEWCEINSISRLDPDREIAAAVLITLFREGHSSVTDLLCAAERHKGLKDLAHSPKMAEHSVFDEQPLSVKACSR